MEDLRVDTFRNRLVIAMASENVRPVDLAEHTGIGKSAISQYLSGKNIPKTDKLKAIADTLNVQPSWLMGYDVPMRPIARRVDADIAEEDFEFIYKLSELNKIDRQLIMNMIDSLLEKYK